MMATINLCKNYSLKIAYPYSKRLGRFFWLVFLFIVIDLRSQVNIRGSELLQTNNQEAPNNIFALVIGVSKYQNVQIPKLDYADDDARAFFDFLTSKSGGNVAPEKVFLLTNDSAKYGDITSFFARVAGSAKAGDKMLLYFAGHGFELGEEQSYLLANDATPELDAGFGGSGVLNVIDLKNSIKRVVQKGVTVVFITDACRNNLLTTASANGEPATSILDKNYGEIQITSCSKNEVSREGSKWGGGRGLFSFYLIDGLVGMADKDSNGTVTLYELQTYVTEKVNSETNGLQNPYYCCSQRNQYKMSQVDKNSLFALIEKRKKQDFKYQPVAKRALTNRKPDSAVSAIYYRFKKAISVNRLVEPKPDNAFDYYLQLKAKDKEGSTLLDAKYELQALLINKAQEAINNYLKGDNSSIDDGYFRSATLCLKKGLELIDKSDVFYNELNAKLLFLEGRTVITSYNRNKNFDQVIEKLKTSIKLQPNASYTYQALGLIYLQSGKLDEALATFRQAFSISPKWKFALNNIGLCYAYMGKTDSAVFYYNKALVSDPNYYETLNNLGVLYSQQNKDKLAETYFRRAINAAPKWAEAYNNLGVLFYKYGVIDSAFYKYKTAVNLNPNNARYLRNLATVYTKYENYDAAIDQYSKAVQVDPYDAETYLKLSDLYLKMKDYPKSISTLQKLISIDSSDTKYFDNLGYLQTISKDFNGAINTYTKAARLTANNKTYYYYMACLNCMVGKPGDGLANLKKALEKGFDDFARIDNEKSLAPIKSLPEYLTLIAKYKK